MTELLTIIGLAIWMALSACPLALTHCCCGCTLESTTWTVVSGSWTFSGSTPTCTSAGIAIFTDPHPDGLSTGVIEIANWRTTFGVPSRALLAYSDASNYLAIDAVCSTSFGTTICRLRAVDVTGGVETTLATGSVSAIQSGGPHPTGTLRACYDGTTLKGWFDNADTAGRFASVQATVSKTGTYMGISSGIAYAFGAVTRSRHRDATHADCPACYSPCTGCLNQEAPILLKTVVAGVAAGGGGCATPCTNVNGTYLSFAGGVSLLTGSPCKYDSTEIDLAGGKLKWTITACGVLEAAEFSVPHTASQSCLTWVDELLPNTIFSPNPPTHCDWSAATVRVTSL